MREVKYRWWDFAEEEMLSEYDLDNRIQESGEDGYFHFMKVARYAPLQYTGLEDKFSKQIFDGDILEVKSDFELRKSVTTGPIKWNNTYACFECVDWMIPELVQEGLEIEIIGNIYEHPHLLR